MRHDLIFYPLNQLILPLLWNERFELVLFWASFHQLRHIYAKELSYDCSPSSLLGFYFNSSFESSGNSSFNSSSKSSSGSSSSNDNNISSRGYNPISRASVSDLISIFHPVNFAASRAFCPRLPIAKES